MSDDDDITPVIDEGYVARAAQIDWSTLQKYPPSVVQCRAGHGEYRSHAKYDLVTERLIAKTGCPVCHTHELRRSSTVDPETIVAGEIASREVQTVDAGDVADHKVVLDVPDDPSKR